MRRHIFANTLLGRVCKLVNKREKKSIRKRENDMKSYHHHGEKSKESMVGRKWENNTRIQSINQSNVPGEWLLLPSWGTIVRIIINSIIILIVSIAVVIINVIILIKYEADIVLKFRIFGQPWNTNLTGSLSQYFQDQCRPPGNKTPSTPKHGWSFRSDSWTSFQAPLNLSRYPWTKGFIKPPGHKARYPHH